MNTLEFRKKLGATQKWVAKKTEAYEQMDIARKKKELAKLKLEARLAKAKARKHKYDVQAHPSKYALFEDFKKGKKVGFDLTI